MQVAFGNRDNVPEPTPLAGRADWAARNMPENLVLFTAAVVAVQLSGKASAQSQLGASIFSERALSIGRSMSPASYLRTAIWLLSIVGLAMVTAAMWQSQ